MIFFCESREKKWGGFGDGRGRKPGVRGVLTIPCASPSSYRACTHAATSRAVVVSVVGSPHANQAGAIPTSLFGNFQRASGDHGAGKCASATGHRRQKRAIIHARWRDDHPGPSGHAKDLTRGAVRHDVTNRAHHKWGRAQVLVFDGDEIQIPGVFSCEKWSLEFVWVFRLIGVRPFSALCRPPLAFAASDWLKVRDVAPLGSAGLAGSQPRWERIIKCFGSSSRQINSFFASPPSSPRRPRRCDGA